MKISNVLLTFGIIFLLPLTGVAKEKSTKSVYRKDLSLPANTKLKILAYDKALSMVQVESVLFPAEGSSWLRIRDLTNKMATPSDFQKLQKNQIKNSLPKTIGRHIKINQKIMTYLRWTTRKNKRLPSSR